VCNYVPCHEDVSLCLTEHKDIWGSGSKWSASCPDHFTSEERDKEYPVDRKLGGS
jgi:hypothetical protein